jgi:hypothetical protein
VCRSGALAQGPEVILAWCSLGITRFTLVLLVYNVYYPEVGYDRDAGRRRPSATLRFNSRFHNNQLSDCHQTRTAAGLHRLTKYVRVQTAQTSKFAGDATLTPARVHSSITTTIQRVPVAVEHARQPIGWP